MFIRLVGEWPRAERGMSPWMAHYDGRQARRERADVSPLAKVNRAGNWIVVKNSNQIDRSLGGRLREKRTSNGWSQEQLAEKLQVDPGDIYAHEAGTKRITADRLLRLSKILGVKPVYFFGFDDNERHVGRDEALLTLTDQGLRLHRAFIGVKNPALREAIVSLVIELARNETPV
jgi:transcriptional regulator with XRE-family HTH domain